MIGEIITEDLENGGEIWHWYSKEERQYTVQLRGRRGELLKEVKVRGRAALAQAISTLSDSTLEV